MTTSRKQLNLIRSVMTLSDSPVTSLQTADWSISITDVLIRFQRSGPLLLIGRQLASLAEGKSALTFCMSLSVLVLVCVMGQCAARLEGVKHEQ